MGLMGISRFVPFVSQAGTQSVCHRQPTLRCAKNAGHSGRWALTEGAFVEAEPDGWAHALYSRTLGLLSAQKKARNPKIPGLSEFIRSSRRVSRAQRFRAAFFFDAFLAFLAFLPPLPADSAITALAAARRAIGTRNGEQLT